MKTTKEYTHKSPEMENFLNNISLKIFGRSRSLAKAANNCVNCGKPAHTFSDKLSKKEYQISGLCQICQDDIWDIQ